MLQVSDVRETRVFQEALEEGLEKVRQDKLREVRAGHDGTWVAHPALVRVAKEVFDQYMPQANQISIRREDVRVGRGCGGPPR